MSKDAKAEKTEGLLVDTAKAIGSVAGKLASLAGVSEPKKAVKASGKLVKKNKTRVPRKEKKALSKVAAKA